ncbi:MAG: YIEGIA domain-containing protein [Thermoanaerobacteraceae bacterium]|uniref:YIEGIA family protein n=1 Tax=Thermanaeromonas sp. C210 TaxID=2731925 RepID=UPI00155D4B3A|nr:YIEGIA family protein [Thermanaeromonas sp. C210]MBE3581555.1 YIEGIA domain-containing protein [Thermoanaerobacteraceae bacterium]GFN23469.1 hypothetical protein TAMC210_17860 [Thermanaeromonas sp. C210]
MDVLTQTLLIGLIAGLLCRVYLLQSDYRRYPGYPHSVVTHLSLAAIASLIGAVAVPALAAREYTAVTFLALVAQQFREIRNLERQSLAELEEKELVPRGRDYIEGIARVFESRNYLVMFTSLGASLAAFYFHWSAGIALGVLLTYISGHFKRGQYLGEIAVVEPAEITFRGPFLTVNGVVLMNVGLKKSREKILREGLAAVIKPKNDDARAVLHDAGQRQAILHTVATLLGTKLDIGEQEWTPIIRKNIDTGELVLYILPNEPDMECLLQAVRMTPVLESAVTRPLKSRVGRAAAD